MKRCIITYAHGAHEELLDISLPTYKNFAHKHGYDFAIGYKSTNLPPAWNKIPLMLAALSAYEEVVWFDCDLVVVNPFDDFPPIREESFHALVRHFEHNSEVPNSGVWRVRKNVTQLLVEMMKLEVFENHGWWEQAALLTLMGYCVPPEGSHYQDTQCRCVRPTRWYTGCEFMRLCWNCHPNYRAEHPRIVHCSYRSMPQRLDVMRALVKDPCYDYPKFEVNNDGQEENDDMVDKSS